MGRADAGHSLLDALDDDDDESEEEEEEDAVGRRELVQAPGQLSRVLPAAAMVEESTSTRSPAVPREYLSDLVEAAAASRGMQDELQKPSGLKWVDVGSSKPAGVGITNQQLSDALAQGQREFSRYEFDAIVGVKDLTGSPWISAGESFCKPIDLFGDPEVLEAAAAFRAMETEGNAVLTLEQFETALVGHAMSSGGDQALSLRKVRRMFDTADLNRDGLVDFNEFLAMRRRAQRQLRRREKHAGKTQAATMVGTVGTGQAAATAAPWLKAARVVQLEEEERWREVCSKEQARIEARFNVTDSLADLDADELLLLETELIVNGSAAAGSLLDGEACRSALEGLALRLGKIFDTVEVEALISDLQLREGRAGSGTFKRDAVVTEIRRRCRGLN